MKIEGRDYIVCKICKAKIQSLYGHMIHSHGISIYEYEKKFPKSKTICSISMYMSLFRASKRTSKLLYNSHQYKEHKQEHPCNTYEIIKGIHDIKVNAYLIDDEFIILCWFCAAKLGFFSKEKPKWVPDNSDTKVGKNDVLNYARNNPYMKINPTVYNKGQFFSNKNNKIFFYRSGLELKHLLIMERDKNIAKFSCGPRITYDDYINERGKKYYFVDWKIEYKDGSIKLVETKPLVLLKCGLDDGYTEKSIISKIESVEEYCKNNNYTFEFWTEE